jgi:hypothetical protein
MFFLSLSPCRAVGDTNALVDALLLQSQLLCIAQQWPAATELIQAAQQLGGTAPIWRESVSLYANCRGSMVDGGERDARQALESAVDMFVAVARWG